MPRSLHLAAALACVALIGCTPTEAGRWCDQENEVGLLAQTPSGIPLLRVRELQGPFEVELEWTATRHAFEVNGGVHPTQAVFERERTVATFSVEPRSGRALFAQSVSNGECGDDVLIVPVTLRLRTADGRIDATVDAEAEFNDAERSVIGSVSGLAVDGLEFPDCDPHSTALGFSFEGESEEIRPYLTLFCKADPESEAYEPRKYERLYIPRETYVLGTWHLLDEHP